MHLKKRKATESDIPFLLSLRKETMSSHLAASGEDCSDESHLARLLYCFDDAEVLINKGNPVGLLKVRREPEAWEIIQIQLSSQIQGKNIGRKLLEDLLADAATAGAGVKLSVLRANPARNLYERLGFKVVSENAREYLMAYAT